MPTPDIVTPDRRGVLNTAAGFSLGLGQGPGESAAARHHEGGASMEISIRSDSVVTTLINVVVVDPEQPASGGAR
jgi:hypothetical protein